MNEQKKKPTGTLESVWYETKIETESIVHINKFTRMLKLLDGCTLFLPNLSAHTQTHVHASEVSNQIQFN